MGYYYTIQYKPGKTNLVGDALSWRDLLTNFQFFSLTTPSFDFLKTLAFGNKTFPNLQAIQKEVEYHNFKHQTLKIINGILYHKGIPFLGKDYFTITIAFVGISWHHIWRTRGDILNIQTIKMFIGKVCIRMLSHMSLHAKHASK